MCDVAENTCRKLQTCYPVLMYGMGTDFHKNMSTRNVMHLFQQCIQADSIRRSV